MITLPHRKGLLACVCAVTLTAFFRRPAVFPPQTRVRPPRVRDRRLPPPASSPTTFKVTYDGNGSTGGSVPVDATAYSTGGKATVLSAPATLVKSGYAFSGWGTVSNGSGAFYASGSVIAIGKTDVKLYAVWITAGSDGFEIFHNL